ncbi:MAG TPA: hybrid sensor histidine kinase/response regulator [Pseudomonadales bacterium]|nr:hybrid sensor histidine kinase/response regulator [Pseudomonadales bacterium]
MSVSSQNDPVFSSPSPFRSNDFNAWRFFDPELERLYRHETYERLLRRTPVVAAVAFICMMVFGAVDYHSLPHSAAMISIALRCISMGFMGSTLYFALVRQDRPKLLMRSYLLTYLSSGLALIGIVWASQQAHLFLPYDGLFIVIMFGYFLLGLPFAQALWVGILLIFAYLAVDVMAGTPAVYRVYNTLFLVSANAIGAVGYYYFDQTQRTAFLRGQLITHAKTVAEQKSQQTTRFLAVASHDLRQPIQALRLAAERGMSSDQADIGALPKNLYPLIEHINTLVTGFFDISKSQYGALVVEKAPFSVAQFLAQFVETVQPLFVSAPTRLCVTPPDETVWVETDPILLDRVLRNLLHNALTHAHAKTIWVFAERQQTRVVIGIADDGVGLPERQREALFQEFKRSGSTDGLGLGLAIVRELTEQMGCPLQFTSDEETGSRFWLTLARVKQSPISPPKGTLEGRRILVLDDAEEVRHHHASVLARAGAQVESADNAEDALMLATAQKPDLLVFDYHLGETQNGIELIRSIRMKLGFIPAILATADDQAAIRDAASREGICFANKPLTPMKLILLAKQQLEQQPDA